jgi:hypothetical protein
MGFFLAWDGWDYFLRGADVSGQPEFWIQDLRKYILPGLLWVIGGLGFCVAAYGIWSANEWGRKTALYAGAAIVMGWIIIKIISLGFGLPAPLLDLFVGISALFSLSNDVRKYCAPVKRIRR